MRSAVIFAALCVTVAGGATEPPLPLTIEAKYEALPVHAILEVDLHTFPLAAHTGEAKRLAVAQRSAEGGFTPLKQWRSASGNWFFELPQTLERHGNTSEYVIGSFAPEAIPTLAGMEQRRPEPATMRLEYRGEDSFSRKKTESGRIPVTPGRKLQINSTWQLETAPSVTAASLPGPMADGSLPTPHQIEDQLSGFISNIRFYDAEGKELGGPDLWELHRLASAYPLRKSAWVTVPEKAAQMAFTFEFQGAGELVLAIQDLNVIQLPPDAVVPEYELGVAGKVTFPQWEQRLAGEAWQMAEPLRVQLSERVAALPIESEVLLDGLRDFALETASSGTVRLGLLDELPRECAAWRDRVAEVPAEGYFLKIEADGVWILGRDQRGLFYGVQELGERLRAGKGVVPAAVVIDYPAMELRIVHQLLTWNHPTDPKAYYEKWLPELARHRINLFAFDARRDWFQLDDAERRTYWQWLGALCRKWQIMPLPMGMNFRNLQPIPEGIEWAAAKWTEDEAYTLNGTEEVKLVGHVDGYFVRSGDNNGFGFAAGADGTRPTLALTQGDNPFIVRSATDGTIYRRDVDYGIESDYAYREGSNGYTLPGNSLTLKWPTGVRRTANSAIPDGGKVLISYNYLYRQRGMQNEHFSSCISESAAIAAASGALREMVRTVEPEWIHINQDEIVGVGRDGRDLAKLRANGGNAGALFADLLETLKDTAREEGIRNPVIAWSDNFTPTHAGWSQNYNGPFYLYGVRDFIDPDDYLIDVWGGVRTAEELLTNGYSILVAPLENKEAIAESAQYLADRQRRYGAKRVRGIQLSCWRAPDEANFLYLRDFARLGWNPGPWGRLNADGKLTHLYDLYARPVTLDGVALPSAAPEMDAWNAWRAGWCVAVPPDLSGAVLEAVNDRGYEKMVVSGL